MRQVIAIDGPSGSGKTTIAKLIALELEYSYLDTGALYRAVAFSLRKNLIQPDDEDEKIDGILRNTVVKFRAGRVFLNDEDVTDQIRSNDIDHYSSVFSARKVVRDFLLGPQREASLHNDLVVEGRDTTTVVFPDAQKKIFLDASVEERAKRRFLQYNEKGIALTLEEAKSSIMERDRRDASRDIAPLAKAPDALLVDSSNLPIETVKNTILDFIRRDSSV
jgi:cytidylate kinase